MKIISFDRAAYNQGANAQFNPGIEDEGITFTVIAKGPGGVCYMRSEEAGCPMHTDLIPETECSTES